MLIKSFKLFESNSDIDAICDQYEIEDYTINEDGSIDVNGDVNLGVAMSGKFFNYKKIPLKFNRILGSFDCSHVTSLNSLEGSPKYVDGNFTCFYNKKLTSLEGCPEFVGGQFHCNHNNLISLNGCPTSVGDKFNCVGNKIRDFGSRPFKFKNFECFWNPIGEIYELNPCQEFIEYLIEYEVIRGNKIVEKRLTQSLIDSESSIKLNTPFPIKFQYYKLI